MKSRDRMFIPTELGDGTELCTLPGLFPGTTITREVIFTMGTVYKGSQDVIFALAKPALV